MKTIIQVDQEMVEALQCALNEGVVFAAQCQKILVEVWGATPNLIDQQGLLEAGVGHLIDCCVKGISPTPYKQYISFNLSMLSDIGLSKMGLTRDEYRMMLSKGEGMNDE